MKKIYLLPILLIANIVHAEQNTSTIFLVDEVIANVGTEPILLSDYQTILLQMQYKNEDVEQEKIMQQLLQNAALIAKAKENSTLYDFSNIKDKVNAQMDFLLNKFSNNKKVMEKYFGEKVYTLKKKIEKNLKEQYFSEKIHRELISNVRCTHRDVSKFYNSLTKEDKIPMIDESFEAYELVLFAEEDPKILTTLLDIKKRIDEGEDFVSLVKEYSQDEDTVADGGDLGWCKIGELVDEYEKAVLNLKPGEISNIVKTERGYYIIQLIDINKDEFNTRHIFLFSTLDSDTKPLVDKANEIRMQILNHELTWNEAIKKFSDKNSNKANWGLITPGYKNAYTIKDFKDEDSEIIKNMRAGEISLPMPCSDIDKNGVRIIYLRKINPQHKLNLHDDYEQVADMARAYKNQKILTQKVRKVVDETNYTIDDNIVTTLTVSE